MQPLAQPPQGNDPALTRWLFLLWKRISSTDGISWLLIDKTGSNLADLETSDHADLNAGLAWTGSAHTGTASKLAGFSGAGAAAEYTIGTGAGEVAAGDHNHTGVYEPADATILKDADIGVSVQAYDADIATVAASQAEMEAGTEAALRSMSPLRVAQAIAALSGGGVSLASVRAVSTLRS